MIYLFVLWRLLQYFSEFIDFVFTALNYAKRTLVFRKRTSGSELILIYVDYFIIITSLNKYFELIEIYSWRKELLVVTKA